MSEGIKLGLFAFASVMLWVEFFKAGIERFDVAIIAILLSALTAVRFKKSIIGGGDDEEEKEEEKKNS